MDAGADYLAFGSFFASAVKPGAARASLAVLQRGARAAGRCRWSRSAVSRLPTRRRCLAAGADALAVISALFHVPDTYAAAQAFARLFAARSSSAPLDATA